MLFNTSLFLNFKFYTSSFDYSINDICVSFSSCYSNCIKCERNLIYSSNV